MKKGNFNKAFRLDYEYELQLINQFWYLWDLILFIVMSGGVKFEIISLNHSSFTNTHTSKTLITTNLTTNYKILSFWFRNFKLLRLFSYTISHKTVPEYEALADLSKALHCSHHPSKSFASWISNILLFHRKLGKPDCFLNKLLNIPPQLEEK